MKNEPYRGGNSSLKSPKTTGWKNMKTSNFKISSQGQRMIGGLPPMRGVQRSMSGSMVNQRKGKGGGMK